MHHYVKSLHSKFIKTLPGNFLTVYRGQMMTAGEFAKLQTNINGFIAINTFFSTTYSSVVAITFAGDGSGRPMFESIFFEIEINLSLHKTPFADVHKISQFGSEKEIILSMGSSFRIEFIEPMSDKLWHVKLISASEKDTAQLDDLARYLKKNINNESNYLLFGKILRDMGQYDQAEKFYELLLTELPSNHQDIAAVYSCLGSTIAKTQKNLRRGLYYLRQSLMLQVKEFPKNFILFADTLIAIGGIFIERRKYQSGLRYYQLVRGMFECVHPKNHSRIILRRAKVYNNIGYVYSEMNQFSCALKYYKISVDIETKLLPSNHPSIATGMNNIATAYLKKQNFSLANKYFQQANEIRPTSLPFDHHPDHAQMYNNLGTMEYEKKTFRSSISSF
ncbi:unnamed protein product [Rotaria socialis]|uniref:Mono(ADP-ribosyl)transferase n=1 Tax=Rotaria socialis TaxID=392032 RepID=A0A818MBY5_9BILA|nr:unnamed protein product [Rotaria socialis]CAF4580680.1 unnamed protein product [Rotaria socialis]